MIKKVALKSIRLLTLLIASVVVTFMLVSLSPIDPVQAYIGSGISVSLEQRENITKYWGLDKPAFDRFFIWANEARKGNFGTSSIYRAPVEEVIMQRAVNSILLIATAWLISGVVGFVLGILMGVFKDRPIDFILKAISLALASTPTFWIGMLILMVFSVYFGLFPVGLSVPIGVANEDVTISQKIYHMVLPALALSLTGFANIALHTRQKLVDVLESDYVTFAKSRGEGRKDIILRHGLRNIVLPAITLQFASLSELFGGAILAEQVFSYPGLGQAVVQAGLRSDIPLLLGITICITSLVFIGNFIADVLYTAVDPRIKND